MSPEARHKKILESLRLEGQVQVKSLARQFQVTEDCIRKDLALLSRQKKLQRIHGGAIPIRENPHALRVEDRLDSHEAEKREIAVKALDIIEEGMTIFLDVSTVCLEVARLIAEKNLNVCVVTNMVQVLKVLSVPGNWKLHFIGGTLNHSLDGFAGAMTIDQINRFHFDIAFLGAVGIDLVSQKISTYDADDGLTKLAAMDQADQKVLLAEKMKIMQQGNYIYASCDEFSRWIQEQDPQQKDLEKARNAAWIVQ